MADFLLHRIYVHCNNFSHHKKAKHSIFVTSYTAHSYLPRRDLATMAARKALYFAFSNSFPRLVRECSCG